MVARLVVAVPTILKKIVQHHGADELGDFRSVITGSSQSHQYHEKNNNINLT
jgi:hypothetical protein